MRKLPLIILLGLASVLIRCSDKDSPPASPPTPSFTVDKVAGLSGVTEFTFTINKIDANSVSILPYGIEKPNLGGRLISPAEFNSGVAKIKFTYPIEGTFNAVVVANNYTGDGQSAYSYSSKTTITITNNQAQITDFKFVNVNQWEEYSDLSTKTVIDQAAKTIVATVAYGTDVKKLRANFSSSSSSTVTIGSSVQQSNKNLNDFTTPLTYTVKSFDGSVTNQYLVTAFVTPVETKTTFKSVTPVNAKTVAKKKVLGVDVDNIKKQIVVYDTLGYTSTFDSVAFDYALDGSLGLLKFNNKKFAAKSLLNLSSVKDLVVFSQDSSNASGSGIATYKVLAAKAPKLTLALNTLNPKVAGSQSDFAVTLTVLKGTNKVSLPTTFTTSAPAGVVVNNVSVASADGTSLTPIVSGNAVDYSKADTTTFVLNVTDSNIGVTYQVRYLVSVKTAQ
jgi:hypothetical protein